MRIAHDDLECALLPLDALPRLASLRCEPGLRVAVRDAECWMRWETGNVAVVRAILPIAGCRLFAAREGRWYALGQSLPTFHLPALDFRPLAHVLFPMPLVPIPAPTEALSRVGVRLVADGEPRATRAAEASLEEWTTWGERMPGVALRRLHAAWRPGRLFVIGKNIPCLPGDERFWGQQVLVPLGFRLEPCLSESDLRRAASVAANDLLILRHGDFETIDRDLLSPLTHAGLRLARAEAS